MQFTTFTALFCGIFAVSALACGTPGEQCNNPGGVACQCNAGNLVSCETRDNAGGYAWRFYGDCPPNAGGLACVNDACAIHA